VSNLIIVTVEGQARLQKIADSLAKGIDTQAILDEGAAVIYNRVRTRFIQALAPDGTPWPVSHAAELRATGKSRCKGGLTLYASGRLWRGLQLGIESENTRAISDDVPYGIFHQRGTKKLPRRIFLGFAEIDNLFMQKLVVRRLTQMFEV
jgi:phage gpG-like protein